MKTITLILTSAMALFLSSCDSPKKITTGEVKTGMIWETLPGSKFNRKTGISAGSKIEIYERIVIIYNQDGTRRIAPTSQITELTLK